ncbi:MAG: PIN domain-containing protein [Desulfobacterales bacterium]|nr:PIN domain-containing protein [Desulfobacterales bacterium]
MIEFPGNRAFCDTSFFFASLYPKDVNYEKAGQILKEALTQGITLYTTWDIVSETATLLLYRFSSRAALRFLDEIKPALSIVYYDESVRKESEQVFRLFIKDKKLSFCDAISYVVVKTILKDIVCLSFDEDFSRLGLTTIHITP